MIDRDSSEEEVNHSSISVKAVEKNEENKRENGHARCLYHHFYVRDRRHDCVDRDANHYR